MSFNKEIPMQVSSYKIFDVDNKSELEKVANIQLPAGFEYDPEYLYLLVRIVSSGEHYGPNKNGDYFPQKELEHSYETFANAHPFQEHRNKDVANSLGKIISFEWNPVMRTVEVLKAIDRKKSPEIVRGYEKGYMTDVSMGCRVPYTVCSICGNKASKRSHFCDHVKFHRNKFLPNGERVFEINYKPTFHDSSVVLSGAERSAKAVFILNEDDFSDSSLFEKKASAGGKVFEYTRLSQPELEKVAHRQTKVMHPLLQKSEFEKVAGNIHDDFLRKIAAIEKQVTGKILGIATRAENYDKPVEQFIEMIRFMNEGRFEQSSQEIGSTLNKLAESRGVSHSVVFKAFLAVSEMMGIQLYPTELSGIARELTFGNNEDFSNSTFDDDVITPRKYLTSRDNGVFDAIDSIPKLNDLEQLLRMYELAPLYKETIEKEPDVFIRIVAKEPITNQPVDSGIEKVIKDLLSQVYEQRSAFSPNIHSRVLSFMNPTGIMGTSNHSVRKDLGLLTSPRTRGDLLDSLLFNNYNSMRGMLKESDMYKTASYYNETEKEVQSKLGEVYNKPLFKKASVFQPLNVVSQDFTKLLKVANEVDPGNFSSFNDDIVEKYAHEKLSGDLESAIAVKQASLLTYANDEDATMLKKAYQIPEFIVDDFLKYAYDQTNIEIEKVATSHLNDALILDSYDSGDFNKEASDLEVVLKDDLLFKKAMNYFK